MLQILFESSPLVPVGLKIYKYKLIRKSKKNTLWLSRWDTCRERRLEWRETKRCRKRRPFTPPEGVVGFSSVMKYLTQEHSGQKHLHCNTDWYTLDWSKTTASSFFLFFAMQVLHKGTPPLIGVCRTLLKNLWIALMRSSSTPEVSLCPNFTIWPFLLCFDVRDFCTTCYLKSLRWLPLFLKGQVCNIFAWFLETIGAIGQADQLHCTSPPHLSLTQCKVGKEEL